MGSGTLVDHRLRDTHGANAVERLREKFQGRESRSSRMTDNPEVTPKPVSGLATIRPESESPSIRLDERIGLASTIRELLLDSPVTRDTVCALESAGLLLSKQASVI